MLKVAPCTVLRLYSRTSKFFWLDGLLLFCIIMGLRSVSSAIIFIFLITFTFNSRLMLKWEIRSQPPFRVNSLTTQNWTWMKSLFQKRKKGKESVHLWRWSSFFEKLRYFRFFPNLDYKMLKIKANLVVDSKICTTQLKFQVQSVSMWVDLILPLMMFQRLHLSPESL